MVQIGAYLAEPPAYGKESWILPPTRKDCVGFLAEECRQARIHQDIQVCLNLATSRLEWGIEAAECFSEAGGHIVELNIHGGFERYVKQGKARAMVLPGNRSELYRWLYKFSQIEVPLMVKFREGIIQDYTPVLDRIRNLNLFGIHFNIRDNETTKPDFKFIENAKKKYPFFLLASGYIRSAKDAEKLFEAGADMVGIAHPTRNDPEYIAKIANCVYG
jgi:tRNA-dihydrouridine synthase